MLYQLAFVFCPVCGRVELIFVSLDWLLVGETLEVLCEECQRRWFRECRELDYEHMIAHLTKKGMVSNG